MHNRTNDTSGSNKLSNREQEQESKSKQFEREKNPLPKNITEYIQKVRDELKEYEENKIFYEKKRKKEIILQLIDLLEEHEYPKEWLRLIIAQELGDYISTSYIEKILAEKYPDEKKIKKQSTSQISEIPQNDDEIPIEVSYNGESIVDSNKGAPDNNDSYLHEAGDASSDVPTDIKTELELERQVEQGSGDIVKVLQIQVKDLQTRCSRFEDLANETLMWKEKAIQLQRELVKSKSNEMKIIKGKTEIEFGPQFLPLIVEFNPQTKQFSARIPQEVIERVLTVLQRR
jgi:phage host-nuclease inhibitor protein Gam